LRPPATNLAASDDELKLKALQKAIMINSREFSHSLSYFSMLISPRFIFEDDSMRLGVLFLYLT